MSPVISMSNVRNGLLVNNLSCTEWNWIRLFVGYFMEQTLKCIELPLNTSESTATDPTFVRTTKTISPNRNFTPTNRVDWKIRTVDRAMFTCRSVFEYWVHISFAHSVTHTHTVGHSVLLLSFHYARNWQNTTTNTKAGHTHAHIHFHTGTHKRNAFEAKQDCVLVYSSCDASANVKTNLKSKKSEATERDRVVSVDFHGFFSCGNKKRVNWLDWQLSTGKPFK